ncbi:MAG TPA: DUF3300 domain-containing protein [Candidatus Acidoferrales bacterium]|nr:DUF3300 domain-containing protein [Candidatus Acidoferrales bacterium]
MKRKFFSFALVLTFAAVLFAQPPMLPPQELDGLVNRIALYPDPLLAQVLAAATFPNDIPDAARWADQHHYLTGDALAAAISGDRLPWDPSVQALLPFPNVLEMMARDMSWTQRIGDAFLAQQQDVMDAVQRMRRLAQGYGYLRTNSTVVVRSSGPWIEVVPVNPAVVCVPVYDPLVVFAPPRPGFVVGGAINFGWGITVGAAFRPWGWGANHFVWNSHTVVVNNTTWHRTWTNRASYVHPYTPQRYQPPQRVESHQLIERNQHEREAFHSGHPVQEEHHDDRRGRR